MKTMAAGPDGSLQEGHVYDLDDTKADNFVSAGFAVYMDKAPGKGPAPESTMMAMEETADMAAPAPKKKTARKKVKRG